MASIAERSMEKLMELLVKAVRWLTVAMVAMIAAEGVTEYTAAYWSIPFDQAALIVIGVPALVALVVWKNGLDDRRGSRRHSRGRYSRRRR